MLRLSDLVQLHAKIESRHLVIPNPTGPRLHLSFSIWMSLSDANKFAENFLSFCWMWEKLFPQHKPICSKRRFCLEIASVHGWLALHFVFGDWQCPAGQFLEDSPCSVWRSSAIDFLPALAARPASQRPEQWDVVGSEWTMCDAWQMSNWCHWRGEQGPEHGGHTLTLVFITGRKKQDNFKLKSNMTSTFGGEVLNPIPFFFF